MASFSFSLLAEQYRLSLRKSSTAAVAFGGNYLVANSRRDQSEFPHTTNILTNMIRLLQARRECTVYVTESSYGTVMIRPHETDHDCNLRTGTREGD